MSLKLTDLEKLDAYAHKCIAYAREAETSIIRDFYIIDFYRVDDYSEKELREMHWPGTLLVKNFITERNNILKNTQQLKDLSRKWPKLFPSLRKTNSMYPQLWVKNIFTLIRALYLSEQIGIDVADICTRFAQDFQVLLGNLSKKGARLIESAYNILSPLELSNLKKSS